MEAPVKEKKSTGAVIGAVAAIVLCGLTGLCLLCPGGVALIANWGDTYDDIPNWTGYIALCLSVLFIVIGVVVPIVLLRKKKEPAAADVLPPSEPLPPAA
jgi:hypothetical protein